MYLRFLVVLALLWAALSCSKIREWRTRTISVEIALDPEFAVSADAVGRAQRLAAAASRIYEDAFQIRWTHGTPAPWRPGRTAAVQDAMTVHLKQTVPRGNADIVLGISGRTPETIGPGAVPFDYAAVVFYDWKQDEAANARRIAHEVAHLFGAWHSEDKASIMHPSAAQARFDEAATRMIEMMKNYDFRAGVGALDEKTQARITREWERWRPKDQLNPLLRGEVGAALYALATGNAQESARQLERSLRLAPRDADIVLNLAVAHAVAGQPEKAEQRFREAIKLRPERHSYREAFAMALARSGKFDQAVAEFREAGRLGAGGPQTHYNVALVLARQKRFPEAQRELQEALRLNPEYLPAKTALSQLAQQK